MNKIILFLFLLTTICSCEKFVLNKSDVTLSGKYVINRLEITNVGQNQTRDSLYTLGSYYVNRSIPYPFDSITINRFYLHMDYSVLSLDLLGVSPDGRDIWGITPIFYNILSNNAYNSGYLQFTYEPPMGGAKTLTFLIEDDGFETLQLRSSGGWFKGNFGQKQVMTLYLTRIGP
jgi:hypothetical protein